MTKPFIDSYHDPSKTGAARICPLSAKLYQVSWTDSTRPGLFNSCDHCNDDQFSISDKLAELNNLRRHRKKVVPIR